MNPTLKHPALLIDGSSILYRGYYGVRPLHTSNGEPVHAVYNFIRVIKKLIEKFNPEHMAIVWDAPGKTSRHEMYEAYKATRDTPPSDLFTQKAHICEFADLLGIAQLEQIGLEADDLMFSLAKEWESTGNDAVFVTSDKDMGQAISSHIYMYDPAKDILYDAESFQEKMGVPVTKLPFYFSLLGDTSDNIPGVHGIGKKTAEKLVNEYDSLEALYEHIQDVKPPRAQKALVANKDNAFLSRKLFLLQYNNSGLGERDLAFDKKNWPHARPVFEQLEFKSLLKEIGESKNAEISTEKKIEQLKKWDFQLVTTQEQLQEVAQELVHAKTFALDTETDGLDTFQSHLVGISLCIQEGRAYYIPIAHQTEQIQLSLNTVRKILAPIFKDKSIGKILHNAKFDQLVLWAHDMPLEGITFDTMIAARLVVASWQRVGLKDLSEYYLYEPMLNFDEMVKAHNYKNFSYVPLEHAVYYAANDAHQTFRLATIFNAMLDQQDMKDLYYNIEHPLIELLYTMERDGIYLDEKIIDKLKIEINERLQAIEVTIKEELGDTEKSLNLNSPKQVEHLLFNTLQLPPQKKSAKKTGYSTDAEVLRALSHLHPIPGLIVQYRELYKLKSTYIEALPTYVQPKTQNIHTNFRQATVATGRLSSSDPNLQNIPSNGPGIEIRAAFKPKDNHVFISADYSQIELRVLAFLSGDTQLTQAFLSGRDIHRETAARLFNAPFETITHEQRQIGKRINFSILYGLTPYGLAKDLAIPFNDAKLYIDRYFEQYPQVKTWMDTVIADTKEHGYVTTHWGRRRPIPAIYESNKNLYEEARRIAINTKAQGTAAELMKQGMIQLQKAFDKEALTANIVLQIHDELIISVSQKDADYVENLVKKTLESVVNWPIPLDVCTRQGANWKEISK